MPERYDVAIIGGGPAGAAAAITLRQVGASVILLESRSRPGWKIGETLAPGGRSVLQELGVWDEFLQAGHREAAGICCSWGEDRLRPADFIFHPEGSGWQLNRARFEACLLKGVTDNGAVARLGSAIEQPERTKMGWTVRTPDGPVRCQWIIDASGRRATVIRGLGVGRIHLDPMVAVHTIGQAGQTDDHDGRTLVEAAENGWWYCALLPHGNRTVAFLTDSQVLRGERWRSADWFRRQLVRTGHLHALLARRGYRFDSAPRLTSALSGRAAVFGGEGWVGVGDAAMSFDPLSGSGLTNALNTGRQAALAIARQRKLQVPEYGEWCETIWRQYADARRLYYSRETRWPESIFWNRRGST